ncbi:O-antigen ligase family protein [Halobacillus yeomjeoni]|uniref:O-antigen ligase family protein n=1 Tax=Halobacillus yeomjeoni TaxID=311194 RepID=A0A931HWW1_9BACI|nr:O-antigen ligase family protein [Halobacillus yeomjeoni]MBH0230711.1 O-antigen ligase family protein [Halobacillus yeomjeoni]
MNKFMDKEFYTKLLLLFVILQPVLDILTYASIKALDSSLTIGIVVRVLFMGISLWFIVFGNSSGLKKYVLYYLAAIAIVYGIGLGYNFFAKPIFNPFMELQFLAKTVYFSIMLCSYLLLFTTIDKVSFVRLRVLKAIYIAMLIVSITLILAIITGTSSATYDWDKFGFKGWFYSGNELGSIVAISFPLTYLFALYKAQDTKKIIYFIPVFVLATVSILIGTKVPYFAVLGAAIIVFGSYVVYWIVQKLKNQKESLLNMRLIISFIFLVLFLAATPFSPTFSNVSGDIGAIEEQKKESQNEEPSPDSGMEGGGEEAPEENVEENQNLMSSPILKIILSSRNLYFTSMYNYYEDADVVQKLFGMGYAGNYESPEDRKLIEMDFFDLFFSYGILGILLILTPFLMIVGLFIKLLFQVPGKLLHPENMLILLSIGFGTGIAFLAGHVLYAPAVSIYLAISIVLLIINMLKMDKDYREAKASQ